MNNKNTIAAVRDSIEAENQRSAWNKAVTVYALDLLDDLTESAEHGYFDPADLASPKLLEKALLNGADNWNQYSWGGCSLIYNADIAERVCTPSELKKRNGGDWRPNSHEEWLDVQARALFQACNRIKRHARKVVTA